MSTGQICYPLLAVSLLAIVLQMSTQVLAVVFKTKMWRTITDFSMRYSVEVVIPASIVTNPSIKCCMLLVRVAVSACYWHMCVERHLTPSAHHIKKSGPGSMQIWFTSSGVASLYSAVI